MRRKLICIAAALMMVLLTFTACGSDSKIDSDLSMSGDVEKYLEALDLEYAYNLSETLAYDEEYWDCDLGWRTAGSDAEHKCADFLAEEMKSIGLTDIEKIPTKVDKFQFNDSSLTLAGTKIDLMPASYQCNGTDKDGITAEIVNCGTGFEADYEGLDVKDKIVLVKVDQSNESWIDGYIQMANEKGAAAVVSYANSGYGELNDDTINVQDVCCDDLIPTVAISNNQAKKIKKAIKAGNNEATLMVDAVLEEDGTTYSVAGKIKGKSSDQQIMIAGHYDKYWYGFQDDCTAIALDFTVAKAMIDSGYQPENDILVVAHGAEEWGVSDSQFDWTTGAWGVINDAHPEWAETTIAMLNCELPAFAVKDNQMKISCVPEFAKLTKKLVGESGLVVTSGDCQLDAKSVDASNMEDGVSYRWHGVPYLINGFLGDPFMSERYHTSSDDKDTWDEATMTTNLNWYGAFALYIDKTPALELDLTALASDLKGNLNEDIAKEAGVDTEAYIEQTAALKTAAKAHNKEIARVNSAYEEAVAGEASEDEIGKLREEGKALNKISLEAFAKAQTAFLKCDDVDVYIGHPTINTNVEMLKGVISGLENDKYWTDDADGALDYAWQINSAHDYYAILYSKDVWENGVSMYDGNKVPDSKAYWGLNKMVPVVYVGDTTHDLARQVDAGDDIDTKAAIAVYQSALDDTLKDVKSYCDKEMKDMPTVANILSGK